MPCAPSPAFTHSDCKVDVCSAGALLPEAGLCLQRLLGDITADAPAPLWFSGFRFLFHFLPVSGSVKSTQSDLCPSRAGGIF